MATFRAGGVVVNLVDTPGHPDFIAEVDRSHDRAAAPAPGRPDATTVRGATTVLSGTVPSVEVDAVRAGLPTAAHGLAVLESWLDHHAPVPRRP